MRLWFRLAVFAVALTCIFVVLSSDMPAFAQEAVEAAAPAATTTPVDGGEQIEVEIDWIGEMWKGGLTVLAQLVLSVLGLGVAIERLITVRDKHFVPPKLLQTILPLGAKGDWQAVENALEGNKSLLADMVRYIAAHRDNELAHVQQGVNDLGVREMRRQLQKNQPLSIVGALEPLLGLLGTMIGMIEAFGLVAVYGDEGGASLLADSISKALITTAVGLIIAIPALMAYFFFKHRVIAVFTDVERSVERVIDEWFLIPEGRARAEAREKRRRERQELRAAMRQRALGAKAGIAAAKSEAKA